MCHSPLHSNLHTCPNQHLNFECHLAPSTECPGVGTHTSTSTTTQALTSPRFPHHSMQCHRASACLLLLPSCLVRQGGAIFNHMWPVVTFQAGHFTFECAPTSNPLLLLFGFACLVLLSCFSKGVVAALRRARTHSRHCMHAHARKLQPHAPHACAL